MVKCLQWICCGALVFGLISCKQSVQYEWKIVSKNTPKVSFRGIDAVSNSTCWVSGSRGTILKTTNGGHTWTDVSVPGMDSLDFRDMEAFDAQKAIVMSIGPDTLSRIYRTMDGGNQWSLVQKNTHPKGFYDAIAFWDNQRGILQGDPLDGRLFIMMTNDGGRSWQEIPVKQMPEVAPNEYAFAASGTQLITTEAGQAWIGTGGQKARILHSDDYGNCWKVSATPMIQGKPSTGIFSLAFADASYGMAVGGDYEKEGEGHHNIIYTNDTGRHWQRMKTADLDFRSAIRYTNKTFITVGPSGSEFSINRGKSWHTITGPGFHTLSIGKGGLDAVWAAGRDGKIAKLVQQ